MMTVRLHFSDVFLSYLSCIKVRLFFFICPHFEVGHGDDDGSDSSRAARKDPLSNEEEDFAPPSPSSDYTNTREYLDSGQSWWFLPVRSWAYGGIGVLLVILCLSAGLLWYRMSLLHSHLEMRLLSDGVVGRQSSHQPASVSAMYTQQVVDSLIYYYLFI
jgi:hypothetical protein